MFSDKLLSPVSKQSAFLATFFQFKREYIEALLQKHLLCQSKTGGLGLCFTVLFFSSSSALISNSHSRNTAPRQMKWRTAL